MTGEGQTTFRHLSEILEIARKQTSKKLVVAAADDLHVLQAVLSATKENLIHPILVGDSERIDLRKKQPGPGGYSPPG
jgi:phosphate butyryltransferase